MIISHLRFAWRHLLHNRLFSVLNLVGLSTGLAAAILIYLWVHDELQVDHYFANDDQLFQVMNNLHEKDRISTSDANSVVLGEALAKELPEVTAAVTTLPAAWFRQFNLSTSNTALKAKGNFVGKDFFKIFPYNFLHGNAQTALANKDAIVISTQLAKKLFNTTNNLVGKTIDWQFWHLHRQSVITGVYETLPDNASHPYDFLLSLDCWFTDIMPGNGRDVPDINGGPFNTFITASKGTDLAQLNRKLKPFIQQKFPKSSLTLFARKYSSQYLYGKYENGKQAGGRIEYVQLFSLIAIFILVIACINFMNLATARASKRMKETGIKKTLGVSRRALIITFLTESVLMCVIALLFAMLIAALVLPWFNQFTGKQMTMQFNWIIPAITLCTGLLAGSYPAFYLSRFRPLMNLKGTTGIRKALVVFQFALSVFFIIAVMVVHNQLQYIQSSDLGFNKDNVVYFEMEGKTATHADAFLDGIKQVPGVVQASAIYTNIFGGEPGPSLTWGNKNYGDVRFTVQRGTYGLLETLGMQIVKGRSFSKAYGTDTSAIVINEAAVKAMGLTDPIGQQVELWGEPRHIIGVMKDFHNTSLHDPVQPYVFALFPKAITLFMVRINPQHQQAALQAIRNYYKTFNPGFALTYTFLDEDYQAQYSAEKLVATLSKYFATLTIIISCLGLFGLAAFTAESRRKELGIRKVLGATVANLAGLLSKEFIVLVLIAMLSAFPLAWYIMQQWLQGFAYRIHIGPGVFVVAGIAILCIALLTISFQAIRSAIANPVNSLRSET